MTARTRRGAWSSAAVALALAFGGAGAVAAGGDPECFGAAARDAAKPCENPDLHLSATPRPEDAPLIPALTCTQVRVRRPPAVCAFGASPRRARAPVVLLGDSHAPAWRAAVDVLARQRRWRGLTIAKSSCPFSRVQPRNAAVAGEACARWNRDVHAWFRRHPAVRTVFFVNSIGYQFEGHRAAVEGYRAALDALPPTVRRIVVIRDNPKALAETLPCVGRALERGEHAGERCALERDSALLRDPAAEAAPLLPGGRGSVLDLTRFFCDDARCYPVVGGALVFKDTSHITQVFSRTLGPYLAADFRALGL